MTLKETLEHLETLIDERTINFSLVEIGINHPEHRLRAIEIGEKLGVYRDYPEKKGCTTPFAPIWIKEMVSRQR